MGSLSVNQDTMQRAARDRELPLLVFTPEKWAGAMLAEPLVLLNDHAHLEKKAATNALDLLPCWPEPEAPKRWVAILAGIARDEVQHLATVVRILERRGGAMTRTHRNPYAQALRQQVRKGTGPLELVDRLLISALIEARSCERFEILSRFAEDRELARLYKSLWASEHGHYKVFVELAKQTIPEGTAVERRWKELLLFEKKVIQGLSGFIGMHSWV